MRRSVLLVTMTVVIVSTFIFIQVFAASAATLGQSTKASNQAQPKPLFTKNPNDYAGSFVTTFILADKTFTINSFSKIAEFGNTINSGASNTPTGLGGPQFQLQSIPSKDKKPVYDLVASTVNPGAKPQPFDVKFQIYAVDGSLIETVTYSRCAITGYWLGHDDSKFDYRFGDKEVIELREYANFLCSGYSIKT